MQMINKNRFSVLGIVGVILVSLVGCYLITAKTDDDNQIPVYAANDLKVVNKEYLSNHGLDEVGQNMLYENILWLLREERIQMMVDYTQVTFYDIDLHEDNLTYFYCMLDDEKGTILECQIEMSDEYGVFNNIDVGILSSIDNLYKESTKTGIKYIELYDGISYQKILLNYVENEAPDGIDPEG